MRIAFYAPLKSPEHAVPSGDRRVAGLLMDALKYAGHQVKLISSFRSFEGEGDRARQAALREEGLDLAETLIARWNHPDEWRPDLWFSYHVYYKSPDWLGPRVCAALGIPYVIAEASHAPKRAAGPWALGHDAATEAIRAADLVLCPTRDDLHCVQDILLPPRAVRQLPPFLDPAPYRRAICARERSRLRLASEHDIDQNVPWVVVAAMMRPGDKLSSFRLLAQVLRQQADLPWFLLVAGDGVARQDVEASLEHAIPGRTRFLGERGMLELANIYAACDLSVWPAINEAYGMSMLEAQAAGVPVVSRAVRGVPDVVSDGHTGLLAAPHDEKALAELTRVLLVDRGRRTEMGRAAADYVAAERSIEAAARTLSLALREVIERRSVRHADGAIRS